MEASGLAKPVEFPDGTGDSGLSAVFVLLPEFTLMALTGFIEALRHAADEGDKSRQVHCRWTVMGADYRPVRASCGIGVTPWEVYRPIPEFNYVVVVGGLTRGHAMIDDRTIAFLKEAAAHHKQIIGLCTGSFAMARAGLLDHSRCCVHRFHLEEFLDEFPHVVTRADLLYLIDGNRITCAGGAGVIDLAVELVARHCGRRTAAKVVSQMVYGEARSPRDPQTPLAGDEVAGIKDPMVLRAAMLIEENIETPLSVEELASRLALSSRTLSRRFHAELRQTPARYARGLRVRAAEWMLNNTSKQVTEIAHACGFSDASHFARCYRAEAGQSPTKGRRAIRPH